MVCADESRTEDWSRSRGPAGSNGLPGHLQAYTSQGTLWRHGVGFTDVKRRAIACLDAGAFAFEIRERMSEKNLLATGEVTVAHVRSMISRCTGLQYTCLPMTEDAGTLKHELRPLIGGRQWFIRFYFVPGSDDLVMFISVHPSSHWRAPRRFQ
jgi:hypothetical protein